jgi:nucleolar protein 12
MSENTDSRTIFVKNLPYETNEEEVYKFFEKCGPVESVRLVYNSLQKHFKGYAFIRDIGSGTWTS